MRILIINGPNLNMLGLREPEVYGTQTLADIESATQHLGAELGLSVECMQSNSEGELVTRIQQARGQVEGIIINAGAYTHTSIAIRDALAAAEVPFVEVHLSNVHARESFRHQSYLSDRAIGVICGLGSFVYEAALRYFAQTTRT
ncbi:MAG: type II 3-dehydroquinate dehydratase [Alcaligenaceae bacterium]|nr:type II 3-dehydroquinate dehydratase [Alcaligenaceae bacterium]HZJ97128.1 type II 3-dehydroquinate dehydratase [Oligella sp.]